MTVAGSLGMWSLYGTGALVNILGKVPYSVTASWEYSVIPMFVLMGLLLWKSGVTSDLYQVLRYYTRRIPGGLAIGTTVAGAGLAATSGSTIGTLHALGRIGVPEMLKTGYHPRLVSGTVLMSGLIGQVIPPSVFLVIYAGIAEVPVGPQLLAGVAPGVLMAILLAATVLSIAAIAPKWAPRSTKSPEDNVEHERPSVLPLIPLVLIIVIVIGGLYSGGFTATEAGAFGALMALILVMVRRRSQGAWRSATVEGISETIATTGSVFLLLIGAHVVTRFVAVTGLGDDFASLLYNVGLNKWLFLITFAIVILIMGMFLDPLSIMLLTVPLILPLTQEFGIDAIWFGVFVVILAEMAIVTPPVGVLVFIFSDLIRDREVNQGRFFGLDEIFKGVLLFMPAILILLVILAAFPEISLWLT